MHFNSTYFKKEGGGNLGSQSHLLLVENEPQHDREMRYVHEQQNDRGQQHEPWTRYEPGKQNGHDAWCEPLIEILYETYLTFMYYLNIKYLLL